MKLSLQLLILGALMLSITQSQAQFPDLIAGEITSANNYSAAGGLDAFTLGFSTCNIGNAPLNTINSTPDHDVVTQNVYRYNEVDGVGRFEQVGMSWLLHGFTSLNLSACQTCIDPGSGQLLGVGCSNPIGGGLMGSQPALGPRWEVNAYTGAFPYPFANPAYSGSTARRVEVALTDMEVTGAPGAARYFGEVHCTAPGDAAAGNQNNNASWRELNVSGGPSDFIVSTTGATNVEQSALHAWADIDPSVTITEIPGASDGIVMLGSKVTDLGGGIYRYEYALYNMNSDDGIGAFKVPVDPGVTTSNLGFHDVEYRNGDGIGSVNFDGTDWSGTVIGGVLQWEVTESFIDNPNANALRWGTLYNFRFDADAAPTSGIIRLGRFKTASNASVSAPVPSGPLALCGDGVVGAGEECDDGNTSPGDGCDQACDLEVPICGNGLLEPGEECDDGNLNSGDGCDSACDFEVAICGNGIVEPGEECDDGNLNSGDGCDSSCDFEFTPSNNDCVAAQTLTAGQYPTGNTVLGTLWAASASGTGACGSATDVFYSLNVPFDNHYFINVNPFGGADIAWELLNACGGASSGCVDNSGAGVGEAAWLLGLAAGDYILRVSGSAASEAGGQFLINVQSFPTAQVQDNPANPLYACNQAGFQLEDFVGATPQTTPGILDYEWLVAEVGGGTQTTYQRGGPNYVSRCSWLGMDYGKTYNVFVRLLLDIPGLGPTWGVYQGDYQNPNGPGASSCTIATDTSVPPTWVRPNYTPTNAQGNDYALCDFVVAYNVSNSENFRWRFEGNGTPGDPEDIIYTRGSGNPSVRLSWVNGLVPGNSYGVAVEVQVAGNWSGYSITYPIVLALPPNDVAIRSSFCGGTYAPNGYILSESVCDADLYQFRFTPTGGGTPSFRNSGNYVCFLSAASPALMPGGYDVQVKVTQNGVPGDWGPVCTITISGPQGQVNETPAQRDMELVSTATLFPNPNAGREIRVQLDGLSDGNHNVNIVVYDIYGKMISSEGFGHNGESLSRLVRFDGDLAMGIYMVQIVFDGETFATERLIVK